MIAKKSLSQKIARLFEIVNYILLIPTTFIEIFALFYGAALIFSAGATAILFFVPSTLAYSFGGLLLYGYYKHWRGEISEHYAVWLWIGTIIFNLFPSALLLYFLATTHFADDDQASRFWFYNIFGAFQIVILLAVVALINDLRRKFD